MLCAALGLTYDEATISQHCGMTAMGCTVQDLIDGARSLGLNAEMLKIAGETAARSALALAQDVPFVAIVDLAGLAGGPMFQWHFVVPLALASDEVCYHDPADGPDRLAKLDDFLAAWGSAGYRGMRVWTP